MRVFFSPHFLEDLKGALHPDFVTRVLDSLLDSRCQFKPDANDHRYTGIVGAWIRYASRGKTAFRVIYIRQDEGVLIYRAGFHSVEENLAAPRAGAAAVELMEPEVQQEAPRDYLDLGVLASTTKPTLFRHMVTQMFHVAHREIVLVSPFIAKELFARTHHFGRFLDKAIEEGTVVSLITRPNPACIPFFQALEERGIITYFHKTLHSKLYLFDVDPVDQGNRDSLLPRTAIVGSANLTEDGFCFTGDGGNEEVCYRMPAYKFDEARDYVDWLVRSSIDFAALKRSIRRF